MIKLFSIVLLSDVLKIFSSSTACMKAFCRSSSRQKAVENTNRLLSANKTNSSHSLSFLTGNSLFARASPLPAIHCPMSIDRHSRESTTFHHSIAILYLETLHFKELFEFLKFLLTLYHFVTLFSHSRNGNFNVHVIIF